MPFEFRLPDLGEGIEEAQLLTWNVQPGDTVAAFQPLCQVESAKAAVELTAPVGGRVADVRVPAGATAHRGDVLVVIDTDGSETPRTGEEWFGIVGSAPAATAAREPPRRVFAAPFVRRLARDLGVDLAQVPGSGPQGRVRAADVQAFAETRQPPAERVPLEGLRKRIAEHMVEAVRRAPQVTSMDLVDVTELVRARQLLAASAELDGLEKLTYLPFLVKAAVEALRAVPEANATVDDDDAGGATLVLHREVNIGIATAVPGGLIVPVIKGADRLNLVELAREIDRLVTAARERRSPPADLSGGTFTITSFGGLPGSPLFATPILNYPEVAILGVGRIELQPRVVAGQIVPRHCIGVSFTFDHRVLDGEGAGRFMAVLARYLQQPLELLLRLR